VTDLRQQAALARRGDLSKVLRTAAGRRVLGRIIESGHRDDSSFAAGCPDITAFNEGMRAIANLLANSIKEIDPRLLADCEIAHRDFERQFGVEEEEEDDDAD
jgi:hypothetical protein